MSSWALLQPLKVTVGVTGADVWDPATSEGVVTTGAGELDDVPLGDDNTVPTAVVPVVTGNAGVEVVTVPLWYPDMTCGEAPL